jgi:hypothetical protein
LGVGTLLGICYFVGLVGERPTAILCAIALGLVLAAIVLRASFESTGGPARAAGIAFALGCLFLALYPAGSVLLPGKPAAEAILRKASDQLAFPAAGTYRVLVSTHLSSGTGRSVEYRLEAPDQALEGTFARTESTRRSRKGSFEVVDVHDADTHEISVPAGGTMKLASISGDAASGGISVRAFRTFPSSMLWGLMAALIVLGALLEALIASHGALAGAAGAAGTFGLLMMQVNPRTAAGSVLGSALLAAIVGAVGAAVIGALTGKLRRRAAAPEEDPESHAKRSAAAGD